MNRIIAIINQKGGVGKTTTVVNLGAGLTQLGQKVLLIDLDAQAYLTYSLGFDPDDMQYTLSDLLKGQANVSEVLIERNGLSIIPSSLALSAAEIEFATEAVREGLLKNAFQSINTFNFILIDCPPDLGLLTLNALVVANEVFVPLQAEYLSIKGFKNLMEMVEKVKQKLNPNIEITGIIPTQYDRRLKLHNEIFASLEKHFPDKLFKTIIRRNIALAETTSFGQPIFEYAPHSNGAKDYMALCKEVLQTGD